jgi:glycerol-3-phosphate acyltransferase PlsX
MGGDFAPEVPVLAAVRAAAAFPGVTFQLFGQKERLEPLLRQGGAELERVRITDCREVIANSEAPVLAIRAKGDSSLVRALLHARDGGADAVVSAGSTGALMAGALFRLGRIPGVERPALALPVPTLGEPTLLLDTGANVDCLPEYLAQFAAMGAVYARKVLGRKSPRVALLNIGEEAEKGNAQTKAAYKLLAASGRPFQFVGNIEGRGVPMGEVDVVACDGFAGNIFLKTFEGTAQALLKMVKDSLTASLRGKVGGLLAKPAFAQLRSKMSAEEVGGALLLGTAKVVVKAHGNSSCDAFFHAIRQAFTLAQADVVRVTAQDIQRLAL